MNRNRKLCTPQMSDATRNRIADGKWK